MGSSRRPFSPLGILIAAAFALAVGGPAAALASGSPEPVSGGAAIAPPPAVKSKVSAATTAPPTAGSHGAWLSSVTISEYWPVPESWFVGALVTAPGLPGKHRLDWLYSAEGMSMNGEGIGLDGRMYHIADLGSGGWVTAAGKATDAAKGWLGGPPFWRSGGYWRSASGSVTFPLQAGGWSAGVGQSYVPLPGVRFAPGPALALKPYQSIAVDPRVIPLGSRVYIPAYRNDGFGGWFVAQDTGGAIVGHRIDVYRTPPATAATGGQYLAGQRVFVVRPSS
ncbi:MAG TPA: 3D domain-containing protein [Solirubrobacteraceae bacterium]|nr:3D domain-containing protein [Solirubrobacteraceae bacterium]